MQYVIVETLTLINEIGCQDTLDIVAVNIFIIRKFSDETIMIIIGNVMHPFNLYICNLYFVRTCADTD